MSLTVILRNITIVLFENYRKVLEKVWAIVKILVVEDNRANQLVAKAILEWKGYDVDIVEDGAKGVEAVSAGDYDVVLMDIHMPRMDGVQATRRIRGMDDPKKHIPIIAVTADAMVGDRDTYLAAGMDDYISKPISSNLLIDAVEHWRAQREAA